MESPLSERTSHWTVGGHPDQTFHCAVRLLHVILERRGRSLAFELDTFYHPSVWKVFEAVREVRLNVLCIDPDKEPKRAGGKIGP